MKLTKENIALIDKMLIKKNGVIYIDIRLELLDHLATELEQMDGKFEEMFSDFFESKKDFINKMNIQLNKQSSKKGAKQLFYNIFSIKFVLGYIIMTTLIGYLVSLNGKEWFLEYFDVLPIIIPAPISLIILYSLFSSKRTSYTISLVGITNLVLLTYLFFFIHVIRKADNFYWIAIFSFYMTLSFAYYYFYFITVKQYKRKINSLSNKT